MSFYSIIWTNPDGQTSTLFQLVITWRFSNKIWQNLFSINNSSYSAMFCKKNWKPRVCPRCTLWNNLFVEHQRYEVLVDLRQIMWSDLKFKCFLDIVSTERHRGLSFLYFKQLVSSKWTRARRWAPKSTHCSLQVFPWYGASQCPFCTLGVPIGASWLLSRRNLCFIRPSFDCFANRQWTTLV